MNDERPPFFKTWGRLYTAVIVFLVAVIALFDQFTRSFNR
jgi:hypothetical protein